MKKKIVSVLLTCCMTFGGSVSTLAAEENHTQQDMQQDSQNVVDKSENQLVGQEQKSETDNTVTDENSQNNSVVEESVNDTANAENNAAQETVEEEQKETNMEYLDKLIKLCKDNDVEFIATTMPLAATMLVEEQESYKEAWDYFADYFHEKKVPYYNFNREYYDSYGHGLENYVDYDGHMNGDSARQFSEVFGQVVFQK